MIYAPIIIPTLCRSKHFIRLIESLKKNSWACHTDVYIGVDYPPSEKYEKGWREINEYLEVGNFSVFNKFVVFKRDCNWGALKNSRALMQYVINRYDRWIRTDDDCEFSENFLEYMDKCLFRYEKDESIVAVTGYSYPVDWTANENTTCFLQNFNVSTWGLGFWKEKYVQMKETITSGIMLKKAEDYVKEGLYNQMLDVSLIEYFGAVAAIRKRSLMMRVTDVAMRAYLAVEGKYCISPIVSKVRNCGFDGSGCYCSKIDANSDCEAQRYDYSKQIIDCNNSFDVSLDDDVEHLSDNRRKLNIFDSRPSKDVRHAYRIIWLIKHCGLSSAKLFHNICLLFRKVKKIFYSQTRSSSAKKE